MSEVNRDKGNAMPNHDQSKQQAFEMWLAGKTLSEIQEQSTAKLQTVKDRLREWERGKQGVWQPSIS